MSRKKKNHSRNTRTPQTMEPPTKKSLVRGDLSFHSENGFLALYILVSFLIVTFNITLASSPFHSRWIVVFILIGVFVYQVFPFKLPFIVPHRIQRFFIPRTLNVVLLVLISIQIYFGSKVTAIQTVTPIWFGISFLIFTFLLLRHVLKRSLEPSGLKFKFRGNDLEPFLLALLLVSCLLTTRNITMISIDVKSDSISKIIIYSAVFFLTAHFLINSIELETNFYKGSRVSIWIFLTLLNLWLAFRNDKLKTLEVSYYHLGYYAEVLKSLHSGGTLLHDTPSQYGFLNLLLLSWIPIEDSRLKVYVGQGILMFLLLCFVLLVIHFNLKSNKNFFGFSLIIIVIFYFADPELIGPQVYPSSSALRFAPSLVFLLLIFLYSQNSKLDGWSIYFISGTCLLVGALWSAESFVYCVSIFGMVHFSKILLVREQRIRSIVFAFGTLITVLGLSLLILNVYTLSSSNDFADIKMHFMYALSYASGFGSITLQFATPGWIVVFIVCYASIQAKNSFLKKDLRDLIFFAATIGALLGWFTYYLGRAFPENMIAQFPLIIIAVILLIIHESKRRPGLTAVKQALNRESRNFWIPTVALISVLITSIVGQPKFISTFLNTSSINSLNVDSTNILKKSANALLDSAPYFSGPLPIVYEGYAGVLPEINSGYSSRIDITKTWLPVPLGLLEEPISSEIRVEILSRFISEQEQSGYLLYAVKDSFKNRHLQLMNILKKTHECSSIGNNSHFELILCEKI